MARQYSSGYEDLIDEEDRLAQETQLKKHGGLPVTMGNAATHLVQSVTDEEVKLFSSTRVRTCGMCKHFRKEHFGDKQDVRSKFVAELIHDVQWRKEFLGDDPKNMGRCGDKDDTVVGPNSLACKGFRPR